MVKHRPLDAQAPLSATDSAARAWNVAVAGEKYPQIAPICVTERQPRFCIDLNPNPFGHWRDGETGCRSCLSASLCSDPLE
jgi:hypothetical protein